MKLQAVSSEEAQEIVAVELRCDLKGEGLRISAISECFRAMSYLCSAPLTEYEAWKPVASIRLTNMVRHRLNQLWPNLDNEENNNCPTLIELLNDLHDLGDMVRLEGGRWLPAPPHAIRVNDSKVVLLGGGAINTFPQPIAESARVSGRIRLIERVICKDWAEIWEIDEWIGASTEDLKTWSTRFLRETSARFTSAPEDMGEVSVYQQRQWFQIAQVSHEEKGLKLCKTFIGQVGSYFIGDFNRGKLQKFSSIKSDDARRLRFYLDAQCGQSIRVKAIVSQGLITFKLKRLLPKREARVLLLGWQTPLSKEQQKYGAEYTFSLETLPIIRRVFDRLKVELEIY